VSDYKPNEAETLLIAALRSGAYKQATGALRKDGGFCCLGVACDLYSRAEHAGLGLWRPGGQFDDGEDTSFLHLTAGVQRWLGWRGDNGPTEGMKPLSGHNDSGASFSEIADIIERGEVLREETSK
jgi:hypothetical protein